KTLSISWSHYRKIDTGKTLTRWPVFVDHFTRSMSLMTLTMRRCRLKTI
ncbi:hypothetical protein GZE01_005054, partial [Escherichia coli]|nr:hypothetical protein [Escherichia coli]